jgi:hypothetical protein
MNAFLETRRRAAAATLAAGALLVGGAGVAIAPAAAAPSGFFGSGATGAQGFQGALGGTGAGGILASLFGGGTAGSAGSSATGLPGAGLFKALFALFGAVQTQVPAIAAPIITQAQTAGTITAAEGTQLTTIFSGKSLGMGIGMGMGMGGTAGTGAAPQFTKPSAGELTVLHQVITAVLAALPSITTPVLATEVTNGDLTQTEAATITKIIATIASMSSNTKAVGSAATGMMGSTAGAGSFLSTLESALSSKVKPKVKKSTKHAKHHTKTTKSTKAHHSS